jgi:hypothetical protein
LKEHKSQTNLQEIKTFLSDFIESVVVNVERVDGGDSPSIKAKIRKRQLLRQRIMKSLYVKSPSENEKSPVKGSADPRARGRLRFVSA